MEPGIRGRRRQGRNGGLRCVEFGAGQKLAAIHGQRADIGLLVFNQQTIERLGVF
jgi:hypothetical protein